MRFDLKKSYVKCYLDHETFFMRFISIYDCDGIFNLLVSMQCLETKVMEQMVQTYFLYINLFRNYIQIIDFQYDGVINTQNSMQFAYAY